MINIPPQPLLTKDNVALQIDTFCTFRIIVPELAFFKVADYIKVIILKTQGSLKAIISEHTLTEILTNRKLIEEKLCNIIDEQTDPYGIKVIMVGTQKIALPKSMERAMATVAESEKGKEAKTTVDY